MKFTNAVIALGCACSGCASIVNDVTHPVKVETKAENGDVVVGAECRLTNDYGVVNMKSGDTAQVRRSAKDLEIQCTHPKNPNAVATAISRANGGMFGNILLGGGIGAIIDHNKGTAYTYPTWMQLEFGKTIVFDRNGEKEGTPTPGRVTSTSGGATPAAAAAAAEPAAAPMAAPPAAAPAASAAGG